MSSLWLMTSSKEGALISRHIFFLVRNCAIEIWGSYDWPVDSLTCLNKYTYRYCLVIKLMATYPKLLFWRVCWIPSTQNWDFSCPPFEWEVTWLDWSSENLTKSPDFWPFSLNFMIIIQILDDRLKSEPFDNQTCFNHLKAVLVWYSDHNCLYLNGNWKN